LIVSVDRSVLIVQIHRHIFEDIQSGSIPRGAVTTIGRGNEQVPGFAIMPSVSEVIRQGAQLRNRLLDLFPGREVWLKQYHRKN
jgi:hypothetical protein